MSGASSHPWLHQKHHWLMQGPTFYRLHLLLDKHVSERLALIE
jgi:DNA-binding ferritin-like protein